MHKSYTCSLAFQQADKTAGSLKLTQKQLHANLSNPIVYNLYQVVSRRKSTSIGRYGFNIVSKLPSIIIKMQV